MNASLRIVVIAVAAALVVALVVWARGTPHHHGLDVGSLGRQSHATAASAYR